MNRFLVALVDSTTLPSFSRSYCAHSTHILVNLWWFCCNSSEPSNFDATHDVIADLPQQPIIIDLWCHPLMFQQLIFPSYTWPGVFFSSVSLMPTVDRDWNLLGWTNFNHCLAHNLFAKKRLAASCWIYVYIQPPSHSEVF